MHVYDEAFALLDPARDSMYVASLLSNKANILSRRGDFRQAIRLYLQGSHYSEALGEQRSLATVYGNIGIEYGRLNEYEKSAVYMKKAIELNQRIGGTADVARDLVNLGVSYKELKRYDEADSAFRASLAIARERGLMQMTAQNLLNLGNLSMHLQRYDTAEQYLRESMEICRREGIVYGIMLNTAALGSLYSSRGRHREGIAMLQEALRTARELKAPNEANDILRDLSALYEEAGDERNALAYLRMWVKNQSGILGSSGEDAFKRLEAELDLERHENENRQLRDENRLNALAVERQQTLLLGGTIILVLFVAVMLLVLRNQRMKVRALAQLEEKNRIIEQTSERLAESNQLKELLLDVITHDLVSPLSTIRGSAEMLLEDPGNTQLVDVLLRSSTQVGQVAVNASALSRVAIDERIPMSDLALDPMIDEVLDESAGELARAGIAVERRLPAGMHVHANPVLIEVFRNYVGNAIRYAAGGGHLIIDAERTAQGTTIRFTDFGRTLLPDQRESIFQRRVQLHAGTTIGSGLGLAIVRRIARAHDGAAWVEPNSPTGNVFCIRIPNGTTDAAAA
jgi:signal transduction histidine kinase